MTDTSTAAAGARATALAMHGVEWGGRLSTTNVSVRLISRVCEPTACGHIDSVKV